VKRSGRRPTLFFLGGAKPLAFNAVEVVCDVIFLNDKTKD
jgi:hypothetical protein